jgi:hypothetical protein
MLLTLNSLHWENYNQAIVKSQKQVFDKFEIPITYSKGNVRHDAWMDYICRTVEADVYFFVDADCVILNREIFDASLEYVLRNNTFLGTAQASNHIPPYSHVFAAPAFFMITRDCYRALGSPSFCMNQRSDVAEEVSYVAEEKAWPYRAIYPTRFDDVPVEGVWRLGNYGFYGIGTLFGSSIYHLYQSRLDRNVELFQRRCEQILKGEFDSSTMYDSQAEFHGEIVKWQPPAAKAT